MFCLHCGKEVSDTAVICLGCGSKIKKISGPWSTTTMVLVSLLTLLIPLIGIVFGTIGFFNSERREQGGILFSIGIVMIIVYMGLKT
jgi:hypothetical protein